VTEVGQEDDASDGHDEDIAKPDDVETRSDAAPTETVVVHRPTFPPVDNNHEDSADSVGLDIIDELDEQEADEQEADAQESETEEPVGDTPPRYNLRPSRGRTYTHRLAHEMDSSTNNSKTYTGPVQLTQRSIERLL
jgi:hypothetical protein